MADKVQKIREEIEKRYEYWRKKEFSHGTESEIRMSECQHLLLMINSLQEEPVSEDLEKELPKVWDRETLDEYAYQVAYDLSNDWMKETPTWDDVETAVKLGARWKDEHQ